MITLSQRLATNHITWAWRRAVVYIILVLGVLLGEQLRSGRPSVPVTLFATRESHLYNVSGVSLQGPANLGHTTTGSATSTTCAGSPSSLFLSSNASVVDSVCRCIWHRTSESPQTPLSSLWNSDMIREGIRRASRKHLKEDCWNWKDAAVNMANFSKLEDTMMHLLQQNRLSRSIKTRSHPFVTERILEIVLKRMNDPGKNPPLRIAAFGGSVTEGYRSRANTIGMDTSQMHNLGMCTSWPCKLEHLLNEVLPLFFLLGENATSANVTIDKIVEVKNFAVSGTDSSIGVTLLEYDLLGADMTTTDVVISAFAANDMQAPVRMERDLIMLHMQRFLKVAKAARPCSDLPLLIQTADVIEELLTPIPGPDGIRQKLRYSNEMLETANWQAATSGIMALSYPDTVRDVVYRNPLDDTLVEFGELHPGMSFHTGMAWMIAYGLLDGILQSCDASSLADHGQPEPRAGILFPSLRDDMRANEVPGKWKEDIMAHEQQCSQNHTGPTKCAYQMIAHRLGADNADQVQRAIQSKATNINGWEGFGYPVKKPRRTW